MVDIIWDGETPSVDQLPAGMRVPTRKPSTSGIIWDGGAPAPEQQTEVAPSSPVIDRAQEADAVRERTRDLKKLMQRNVARNIEYVESERSQRKADVMSELKNLGYHNVDLESPMDNFTARFDLARADNPSERGLKIQSHFGPQAEHRVFDIKGKQIELFRESPDKPWRPISAIADVSSGDLAGAAGSVLNEQFPAQVAAAYVTRGASLLPRVAGQAIAGAAGREAREATERARGQSTQTPSEVHQESAIDAAVGGTFELFGSAGRTLKNIFTKKPSEIFDVGEVGKRVVKASEEEGMQAPAIGQVAEHPIVRNTFVQTMATAKGGQELPLKQARSIFDRLQSKVDAAHGDLGVLENNELEAYTRLMKQDLDRAMIRPNVDRPELAKDLQDVAQQWQLGQRSKRDRLYGEAANAAETGQIKFDLSKKNHYTDPSGNTISNSPTEVAQDVLSGYRMKAADGSGTVQIEPPSRDIKRIAETILKVDPVVGTFEHEGRKYNSMQQVIKLRDELFDIIHGSDNPREVRQAAQLWSSLKAAMDIPEDAKNAKSMSKFVTTYRAAKEAHAELEDTTGILKVKQLINSDDPELVAKRLFSPESVGLNTLDNVKKVLGPVNFARLQDLNVQGLMDNPSGIPVYLAKLQKAGSTGEAILSPSVQNELKNFHGIWSKTKSPVIESFLGEQQDVVKKAVILAQKGQTDELAAIMDRARASGDPRWANSLRAGVFKHVLDESTIVDAAGNTSVNPGKLVASINNLITDKNIQGSRLNTFMRPADWKSLENFSVYSQSVADISDVATGMQKGEITSGMRQFWHPGRVSAAVLKMFNNETTAKILSQPVSSNLLNNAMQGTTASAVIKGLTAAMAVAMTDAQMDMRASGAGQ